MSSCCGGQGGAAKAEPVAGTRIQVEDMSCSHCAGVITRALETGMPGVSFAVHLDAKEVTVAGDPLVAAALIRDAGYEPRLAAA